ncbi:putative magnesium transporter MRS2-H [Humulus lupulus]|uniref:putative magnesium transporter MRS2-H n=1 Tax=Humulus lupulus TaxID=3486 RepID=UPI002B40DD98|nr:putative magnesium transporter MRS2-H [Humulus lupulus]
MNQLSLPLLARHSKSKKKPSQGKSSKKSGRSASPGVPDASPAATASTSAPAKLAEINTRLARMDNIQGQLLRKMDTIMNYVQKFYKGGEQSANLREKVVQVLLQEEASTLQADRREFKFLKGQQGRNAMDGMEIVVRIRKVRIYTIFVVLLRDPFDDNVIPIVEELQRHLPLTRASPKGHGEEEEKASGVRDETIEENEQVLSLELNISDGFGYIVSCNAEFPFEFWALEVALEAICSCLDARTRELEAEAYSALDELTSSKVALFVQIDLND